MRQSKGVVALICAVWMSLISSLFVITTTARAETTVTIHKGDTLWSLAIQHHTTVAQLEHANHLQSDLIQIHQRLIIPPAHTNATRPAAKFRYVVKRGNSLWSISRRYSTTVRKLEIWNRLNTNVIYPGQTLWIHKTQPIRHAMRMARKAWRHHIDLTRRAQHGIPAHLIPVYQKAGKRYGIPWTVLAAIHHVETNFGTVPEVSADGAEGPMQFMPSTFAQYAVKAPGASGPPNINNVFDAIWTCAHMLAADGYRRNPAAALYLYNHSMYYVSDVRRLASEYAA